MFCHYRTQGFIFKKEDRGEADRIFSVFTKDFGRLELFAKAERKITSKLRSGLELFYVSELEFIEGKSHKTVTDVLQLNRFGFLRKNLDRLSVAFAIARLLNRIVRDSQADKGIWELINKSFEVLNSENQKAGITYYYFFWNLFDFAGYQPELYNCLVCQKRVGPKNLYFSTKEGGVICGKCSKGVDNNKSINPDVLKILRIILTKDWDLFSKIKIEKDYLNSLSLISQSYLNDRITI